MDILVLAVVEFLVTQDFLEALELLVIVVFQATAQVDILGIAERVDILVIQEEAERAVTLDFLEVVAHLDFLDSVVIAV